MKDYFLVGECREELNALKGQKAEGFRTRYKSFSNNITYKVSTSCLVFGAPASGKSYWVMYELLHLSESQGHLNFIYSPELGDKADIVAMLVHMKSGKTMLDIEGIEQIGEEELEKCLRWLNNYFVIYEPQSLPSVEDIYYSMEKFQLEYNKKVNNICIDNINNTKEDIEGGRQDLSVEHMMNFVHRKNREHQCYSFLVTHTSSQGQPIEQGGIRYYPPPTSRQLRSGESLFRKCFLLVSVWRPPFGLVGEDGVPYAENESHIIVLKAKPAHTATKGFVGKLFFDYKRSKFTDDPPVIRKF